MLATIFQLAGALTIGINLVTRNDEKTKKTGELVWKGFEDPKPKFGEGEHFHKFYDKYSYTLGFLYLIIGYTIPLTNFEWGTEYDAFPKIYIVFIWVFKLIFIAVYTSKFIADKKTRKI